MGATLPMPHSLPRWGHQRVQLCLETWGTSTFRHVQLLTYW